jgi:hypothetical protein
MKMEDPLERTNSVSTLVDYYQMSEKKDRNVKISCSKGITKVSFVIS